MLASDRLWIFRALCGHHGRPPAELEGTEPLTICPACLAAADTFIDDLVALFTPKPLPELDETQTASFAWWLAGLAVLADWVGSNEAWFSDRDHHATIAAYWPVARQQADTAVRAAGILPIPPRRPVSIGKLLPDTAVPTPMRAFAGRLDLGASGTPTLILIEDQTGSGKTEAALLLAQRLMAEKTARGLFIALPTMATANALHDRLDLLHGRLFAEGGARPSLVLAHGKRHLNDRFMAAVQAASAPQMAGAAEADETASSQCAGWIASDRRRAFLADCGVGTIDQALFAVLPTRHAPLRLFGLRDRVLVIDEAHAYDTYMQEELFRLIEFQSRLGGSTIVLSATLPFNKRQKIIATFCRSIGVATHACVTNAYPLVTVAASDQFNEVPCEPREELARCIRVERLDTPEAAADIIAQAAGSGAAVGWIRNTVDDAKAAHEMLTTLGVDAALFHARFAMGDRLDTEAKVQAWFGKSSKPDDRRHVVVGTQVMEQSLDIDFDLLVTDLAPVDLLLQRAGRLWRHQRGSRPVDAPRLLIVSPAPIAEPAADWLKAMRGTEAVYRDPALLWRSARAIFGSAILRLPDDVRSLVESRSPPTRG